jgi:hypothetical protein
MQRVIGGAAIWDCTQKNNSPACADSLSSIYFSFTAARRDLRQVRTREQYLGQDANIEGERNEPFKKEAV